MKKILLYLLLIFIAVDTLAQSPQGINYQGIARNASGDPIATPFDLRFTIFDGVNTFVELHSPVTPNTHGLFTNVIGQGATQSGSFSSINWAGGFASLKVEIDLHDGAGFLQLGTPTAFQSVPYALFAPNNGNTIFNGSGVPSNATGSNGDFYIDIATHFMYGPKSGGLWGAGFDLKGLAGNQGSPGAPGTPGANGTNGNTILNGNGIPAAGLGVSGDFYIDLVNNKIYGPKSGANWGAGISLTGPAGILPNGAAAGNTPYWNGSNWVTNNSNVFNNGANVGIGTVSPVQKLDVTGNVNVTGNIKSTDSISSNKNVSAGSYINSFSGYKYKNLAVAGKFLRANGSFFVPDSIYGSDLPPRLTPWSRSGPNVYLNNASDFVGIGISSPAYNLDIRGNGTFIQVKDNGGGYAGVVIDKGGSTQNGYSIYRTGGSDRWTTGTKGNDHFNIYNWTTNTDAFFIDINSNNVGIGTILPGAKLSVAGPGIYSAAIGLQNTGGGNEWRIGSDVTGELKFVKVNGATFTAVAMDGTTGNVTVNSFTKLGTNAPPVKMLKITGTTSNAQGGTSYISHGLAPAKILSVEALVDYAGGSVNFMPAGVTYFSGYEFYWYISNTDIVILNASGNSGNILSKPVKIIITYEQ